MSGHLERPKRGNPEAWSIPPLLRCYRSVSAPCVISPVSIVVFADDDVSEELRPLLSLVLCDDIDLLCHLQKFAKFVIKLGEDDRSSLIHRALEEQDIALFNRICYVCPRQVRRAFNARFSRSSLGLKSPAVLTWKRWYSRRCSRFDSERPRWRTVARLCLSRVWLLQHVAYPSDAAFTRTFRMAGPRCSCSLLSSSFRFQ